MRLTVVGAGTPVPSADVFGSSYLVDLGDRKMMFDCGPGTVYKLARLGITVTDVTELFFTHHHYDHDVDYPCFLLNRWDLGAGQERELHVYGPTPTELVTRRLIDRDEGAFAHDWIARINHPLSVDAYVRRGGELPRKPPSVLARDVKPGLVCSGDDWEIRAAEAVHVQPWLDSLAYRLDSTQGSVVVTGDTAPCDSVVRLAAHADVLICVGLDLQSRVDGTSAAKYMTGMVGAGQMAESAGVKTLVLVHQRPGLAAPRDMERAIREVSQEFGGDVVFAREYLQFDI